MSALTLDVIMIGTGCKQPVAERWQAALVAACQKFGITSPRVTAAFLSNVGAESGSLTTFVENLNYSAQGLADTWPTRYAVNSRATPRVPNPLALKIARNPQAIANNCYANRLGNGDEASGDGWKYRGQGPIQITGKDNIRKCLIALGLNPDTDVEKLQTPEYGAASAAWFFSTHGCIAPAEADDFPTVVLRVNGALPCPANGGLLRINRYKDALKAISSASA